MSDAREYVEARWESAEECPEVPNVYAAHVRILDNQIFSIYSSWQAAKDFTVAREQEIAEIEEEIDLLTHDAAECDEHGWIADLGKYKRTLKRLAAIRDDLQRGMKKEK